MYKEALVLALLSGFGIASIPAFLIFLDYHKRTNIHKAVLFVVAMFVVGAIVASLPPRHLLIVAFCVPLMLFVYVAIARSK